MHRGIALSILVLLILGALFAPIRIPFDLLSTGLIMPDAEWRLVQDGTGNLVASLQNNRAGLVQRLASWQFDRGDLAGMDITVHPDSFGQIAQGDTVVRMYSAIVQRQLLDIATQIHILEAQRSVLSTGEKPEIIEEAAAQLRFAEEALTLREKEYAIAEQLRRENVSTELDFQTKRNTRDLARLQIETARKNVEKVSSGEKIQTIAANESQISALRQRLALLSSQNAGFAITAPFRGVIAPITEPGEVLIMQQVNECLVRIPVKAEDLRFITDSVTISITDPLTNTIYPATLFSKSTKTEVLDGRSVGFLTAIVRPLAPGQRITLGIGAQCRIHCGDIDQREYLRRILHYSTISR
jgi:hypothetical protein